METTYHVITMRAKQHMDAIANLFGGWDQDVNYVDLYCIWLQIEKKFSHLAELMCGDGSYNQAEKAEKANKEWDEAKPRYQELLSCLFKDKDKFNQKIYFNSDPRGYALKIELEGKERCDIHTDWGGYGIFAPYDGVDGRDYYQPMHTTLSSYDIIKKLEDGYTYIVHIYDDGRQEKTHIINRERYAD